MEDVASGSGTATTEREAMMEELGLKEDDLPGFIQISDTASTSSITI